MKTHKIMINETNKSAPMHTVTVVSKLTHKGEATLWKNLKHVEHVGTYVLSYSLNTHCTIDRSASVGSVKLHLAST